MILSAVCFRSPLIVFHEMRRNTKSSHAFTDSTQPQASTLLSVLF